MPQRQFDFYEMTPNPWLTRYATLTALATLALLGIGGLVTSHEAGMAVPDWPNSYGYNMFFFPVSYWMGNIFYEHTHRLVASLVGLLTTILAIWLWVRETRGKTRWIGITLILVAMALLGARQMPVYIFLAAAALVTIVIGVWQVTRHRGTMRWLGVVAFAAVILQGVLGGLRVTQMKDEIGIFHGTLAQAFFLLMASIALLTTKWWGALPELPVAERKSHAGDRPREFLRKGYWVATILIFVQLLVGATMRHQHAGLAIPDFPRAYGKIWPATDPEAVAGYNQRRVESAAYKPITAFQIVLQMIHRILAAMILMAILLCVFTTHRACAWENPLTKISSAWVLLIFSQISLGAATIWSDKSADIATGHVLVGALTFLTGLFLILISSRLGKKNLLAPTAPSATFMAEPANTQ